MLDFRTNLSKLKTTSNYDEYHTSVTDVKKYYSSSLKNYDVIFISIVMLAIEHSRYHLHATACK
jgi:hypothetical protein